MKSDNSKYENYLQLSKSTINLEEEIKKMYNDEYEDIFEDIIRKKEGEFMKLIIDNIRISITDKFTEEAFEDETLTKKMKEIEKNLYLEQYLSDYEIFKKNLISKGRDYIENGQDFNFLKHCKYQNDNPIHFCNKKNNFILVYNDLNNNENKKNEIYGIICTNCLRCYKSNYIKLYCDFCQIIYYTRLIINDDNYNSNIQPATWEKYHCHLIINQQMGCINNCKGKLFLDIKKNILICKDCNFSSKPYDIIWTCMKCKQDFHSNAKIYNPYIYKPLSLAIKKSLLNKNLASPKIIPCNHNIKEFYHKKDCNGIIYMSIYNGRKMVLCSKCKSMMKYEKFIFECPFCKLRFRDENCDFIEEEDTIEKINEEKKLIDDIYNTFLEKEIKKINLSIDENKNITSNANTNYTDNIFMKDTIESNLNIPKNISIQCKTFKFFPLQKEEIDIFIKKSNTIHISKNISKKKINELFIIDDNEIMKTLNTDNDINDNKNKNNKIKKDHKNISNQLLSNKKEKEKEKDSLIPLFNPKIYEIISQIGESKKSKIFCVRNIENNTFSALKKINYKTKEELNKIKSQYSLQYSLNSNPYIIKIEGIYSNENEIEILEELGINNWMSEINSMKKMKKLYNEIDLINIIYQISVTLEILQKQGIAHFCINPNNITVFKDSVYKISDFEKIFYISNSKIFQNNNKFISPQLYSIYCTKINSGNFNVIKNDVYSLGLCILYTLNKGNELDIFRDFVNINEKNDNFNLIQNYIKQACKEAKDNNFYSDKIKKLLCNMLKFDENERFDFTQVIDFICKKYEFEE